jgi:NADP-dependent 3-hydroxy acid dehydrogenase YdfG
MKIAITGHTAGIGQALAEIYASQGHEIVGLSKREGHNIRNIPKICNQIESCDMFINNAQAGYAQTEILFEIAQRWQQSGKHIIVISAGMTQLPVSPLNDLEKDQYRVQKIALEEAVKQLRYRKIGLKFTIVRPGDIATNPCKTVPPSADVNNWATTIINILNIADTNDLNIAEISLGPK